MRRREGGGSDPVAAAAPSLPLGPIGHLPTLDGLRGVAILAVVAVHLYSPVFSGGAWGVDLFFVLSGFLITKLAFEERDRTRSFGLRAFYARRVVRLQPALFVMLAFAVWSSYTVFADEGRYIRQQALLTALLSGNLYPFFFGNDPRPVLGHTWSLGLEEQFYFVWPFVLVVPAIAAFRQPDRFLRILAGTTVASILIGRIVFAGLLDYQHWASIPFFNMDGLLLGCMLGVYLHTASGPAPRWMPGWLWAGIAFVTVDLFVGGRLLEVDRFDLQRPVLRLTFAFVIMMAILYPRFRPLSLLAAPVLLFFGRISYSLYLWHVPVFHYFETGSWAARSPAVTAALKLAVSLVVAVGSYALIEQPLIRRYRRRRQARMIVAPPVADGQPA